MEADEGSYRMGTQHISSIALISEQQIDVNFKWGQATFLITPVKSSLSPFYGQRK
jgi:hypothetical protein